uniref:Uncharacterized protein n=2 Tax=Meloidogyne TaxID=189290 RepID=A0A6V7WU74_MELEN|nr:unnamed protein product [Meloidogyne enterolobii]
MEFTQLSYIFQYIEILPLTILIPCSLLNLFLLWKSSVLHNNAKIILISQSIVIFIYSSSRWFTLLALIFKQYNLLTLLNLHLQSILFACISFGNLIGHVLIMERTIATIFTGYGQTKVPVFGICSILILVGNFFNYRRCWVIIVCNYCFNFN